MSFCLVGQNSVLSSLRNRKAFSFSTIFAFRIDNIRRRSSIAFNHRIVLLAIEQAILDEFMQRLVDQLLCSS